MVPAAIPVIDDVQMDGVEEPAYAPVAQAAGAIADPVLDPLLNPHGQQWTEVEAITVDAGMDHQQRCASFDFGMEYNGVKTPIEYFKLLYPMATIATTLAGTNFNLRANNNNKDLTRGEWFVFLGYHLQAALEQNRGNFSDLWSSQATEPDSYEPVYNYGRFGMGKTRFANIQSSFCLNEVPCPEDNEVSLGYNNVTVQSVRTTMQSVKSFYGDISLLL